MGDCLAPRHDDPEPAAPHAMLCRPCTAWLRRDLRRLPALYDGLGGLLDPRRAGGPGTGDGGGLPYHEAASECRGQIVHDVGYWTAELVRDRQAQRPELSLASLCEWLAEQVAWAAYRPWAGDMAGAFTSDARRAMAVLDPMPAAAIPLPGSCPACHGTRTLTATVPQDERDRRTPMAQCGACGREWDATQWYRLSRDIMRGHDDRTAA